MENIFFLLFLKISNLKERERAWLISHLILLFLSKCLIKNLSSLVFEKFLNNQNVKKNYLSSAPHFTSQNLINLSFGSLMRKTTNFTQLNNVNLQHNKDVFKDYFFQNYIANIYSSQFYKQFCNNVLNILHTKSHFITSLFFTRLV